MRAYTWKEAKQAVRNFNKRKSEFYHDWRLPTIEELVTIIDFSKHNPACELWDMQAERYWSTTTYACYNGLAWSVDYCSGIVDLDDKSYHHHVRAVRGGLDGNRLEWSDNL